MSKWIAPVLVALTLMIAAPASSTSAAQAPTPKVAHVTKPPKTPRAAAMWKRRARRYKRQATKLGREVRRLRAILRVEAAYVSKRKRVVAAARRYVGVRYVFGGASRSGIDCSGLVLAAYRSIGVALPHLAASQEHYGRPVRGRLLPGDALFFNYGGHAGIYVGHGVMVEASSARGRVIYQRLDTYGLHFDGARRLI